VIAEPAAAPQPPLLPMQKLLCAHSRSRADDVTFLPELAGTLLFGCKFPLRTVLCIGSIKNQDHLQTVNCQVFR
jgi:hypothetical protein